MFTPDLDLFDVYQTEYGTPLPASLLVGYLRQAAGGFAAENGFRDRAAEAVAAVHVVGLERRERGR